MSASNHNRPRSTVARRARRRKRLVSPEYEDTDTYRPRPTIARRVGQCMLLVPPHGKTINAYLPMELMREIFLYSIESNQMKSDQLAPVCRFWRSVTTTMPHLWSTLRVGTWTEREQVAIWLQRAYPKKIVIDTQGDGQPSSNTVPFAALQDALAVTRQWHELTISSFPSENVASQLGFQVAGQMNELKVLHIAAGCVNSPSFAHLLNLVPTEAPLCELRLHPSFVGSHFLQPHWFPVLQNLTVLIVSGKGMDEPFELLPTFTQLQILEADRLCLPLHGPNTNLPLLCTLRKLRLRACSIQWMVGREFPCLEECAILLPRHWEQIQQHGVQLPSCKKLAYHGYPMTTAQYFDVPEMRAMDLISHDCNEQRVYQHLRRLCRVNGRISNLTTLHLTFQCSEQVLMKVVKYLIPLQELTLSITHPSPSFQNFLELLAAKPSTDQWPSVYSSDAEWGKWCSSQTWHATVLPQLKFLSIQCPKGFSQSERLDNFPFHRAIGWTRAYLTPPLKLLKVWEGRGGMDDTAVDYTSTDYLDRHVGGSSKDYDTKIVRVILTQRLASVFPEASLLALYSTAVFRRLRYLNLDCCINSEILILPYMEQIEELKITWRSIPEYSLNVDLPLTHTLQLLELRESASSWMLGRTFKALREFTVTAPREEPENHSRHEGLRVGLPACTTLRLTLCSFEYLTFLSCPNIQIVRLHQLSQRPFQTSDLAAFNLLHDFLFNLSCLKHVDIYNPRGLGIYSLIDFVFCGAPEHGAWREIRSVKVVLWYDTISEASHLFDQTVEHQPRYEEWWKSFTVTRELETRVVINASM